MKSLFLKIFLSYWVAQALFLALAILITVALRERGESAIWDAQQASVLTRQYRLMSRAARLNATIPRRNPRFAARPRIPAGRPGKDVVGRELAALG